jgi:hypothetical protein
VILATVLAGGAAFGGLLAGAVGMVASAAATSGVTVAGGNSAGPGAGQLNVPASVFVDGAGNVYVADAANSRVQKWAPGENFGVTVAGGNGTGAAANQLDFPGAVFVDSAGDVYVADTVNDRVQEWVPGATTGVIVAGGNGAGSAANQLSFPSALFVDSAGNVYVADGQNNRVQEWAPGATAGVTVAGGNGAGPAANQLDDPNGLFVDGAGNVYVGDTNNSRVQEWAPGATAGATVAGGNGAGSAANQFSFPSGLFVDSAGNVYVADSQNNRVQEWAPGATAGVTVAGGNGQGSGANQLAVPGDAFVDGAGNVYVADTYNNRVQLWGTPPNEAPSVVVNPQSETVIASQTASFSASGSGRPLPAVQWQRSVDGGSTWNNIAGATSLTYSLTSVPLSDNGFEFRAVFTNGGGSATTSAATLTVNPAIPPAVTSQPSSQSVLVGTSVTFGAAASGQPPPMVQWQQSTNDGSTWSSISGATSTTYAISNVPSSDNGDQFRAVFVNGGGWAVTNPATLVVTAPLPTTSMLVPADGATVTGGTWLDATASSAAGVGSVVFEVSGNGVHNLVIGSAALTLYGYLAKWDSTGLANGAYTLQSVATDTLGQSTASAPITVNVDNPPPTTAVLMPSSGATVSGQKAVLDASASGPGTITSVQFVLSGGSLSDAVVATGAPTLYGYLAQWDTTAIANGTYTLQSEVTEAGGTTALSPGITVTVQNAAPTTNVLIPSSGATVSGQKAVLDASASGPGTITSVQFVLSGGSLSDAVVATGAPTLYGYLAQWDTTGVANGTYTVQSEVSEAGGTTALSPGVTVTVQN